MGATGTAAGRAGGAGRASGTAITAILRPVDRETIRVYELHAAEWRDRRPPRWRPDAVSLRADVGTGPERVVADLGCGPGGHLGALDAPVVAIDASAEMLRLAAEAFPAAWRIRADVEALPLRGGALDGAWARACYLHVPRLRLPMALADLHRATAAGAPLVMTMKAGGFEGYGIPGDDFPGRFFARWEPGALVDTVEGAGFAVRSVDAGEGCITVRAERIRSLPDTVGAGMRVLVCGINPSLYAADAGVGFARPGNRFWPAALAAGLVSAERDPGGALRDHGVGMTDLVKRATTRAAELTVEELHDGAGRVERLVRWLRPRAVCFVGLAGWRAAVDRRAVAGVQPAGFGGRPAYVMPSTSGLNAHSRPADFEHHLRSATTLAERS